MSDYLEIMQVVMILIILEKRATIDNDLAMTKPITPLVQMEHTKKQSAVFFSPARQAPTQQRCSDQNLTCATTYHTAAGYAGSGCNLYASSARMVFEELI